MPRGYLAISGRDSRILCLEQGEAMMDRGTRTRFVVTFATTHEAMVFEELAKAAAMPGRLIPVPPQITAGCGMAWAADAERQEELLRWLDSADVRYQGAEIFSD